MRRIEEVAETFNELSERYERWFNEGEGKLVRETEMLAVERLIPEGVGLEVGVGSGVFSSDLEVEFGVDPAKKLLLRARGHGLDVAVGIGEALPFREGCFDYLLFVATLSFLEDPAEALREAYRVLKPKGKVLLCFIPRNGSWGKLHRKKKSQGHDFYRHARFYGVLELEDLLEEAGFTIEEEVSTLFQPPATVERVEEPVNGADGSAGFCCMRAKRS